MFFFSFLEVTITFFLRCLVCFLRRPFRFLTIFSHKWGFYHVERKWSGTWEAENAFNTKRRKPLRPFIKGRYKGSTWGGKRVAHGGFFSKKINEISNDFFEILLKSRLFFYGFFNKIG